MTIAEFMTLMPLIIEAARTVPTVADLIRRVEAGEKITKAEVDASMAKVRNAVQRWDDTPPG